MKGLNTGGFIVMGIMLSVYVCIQSVIPIFPHEPSYFHFHSYSSWILVTVETLWGVLISQGLAVCFY